ncbi:hypothetical protein D6C87_00621 [Aureobasidium pullulans]|uniref:Uncharacterized protein n=1 Tax=Aureobasidium pullulans TaxID=5580 RepID=A0AB38M8G2_AURPU|nr:hypothetical protein D6C94_01321 [Aureobasidium pullulans]THZ48502.1 hypothetical protein D6C87_00621 [Aureobasidium pullulans]
MALRVFRLLRPSIPSFHVSLMVHSPLIMILRVLIVVFRLLIASFRVLFVVVRPLIGVVIIIRTVGVHFSCYNAKTY